MNEQINCYMYRKFIDTAEKKIALAAVILILVTSQETTVVSFKTSFSTTHSSLVWLFDWPFLFFNT